MFINSFIIIQLTIPDTNNKNYITNKSGWAYLKKMSAFLSSILDDHKWSKMVISQKPFIIS